ncbi:helix-turn-helix domain-containing protein [Streptomyces scopuliridis]|uniref:helix-turn-helix domain-containing protein n=1 Tax=Streptomyces scopuliridis TaxID=452529 RepID=UPI0036A54F16
MQIAEEAGASPRTLFRYFGTKEELVCGEQDEPVTRPAPSSSSRSPAPTPRWAAGSRHAARPTWSPSTTSPTGAHDHD